MKKKISITVDQKVLDYLKRKVKEGDYQDRSSAFEHAVYQLIKQDEKECLAGEEFRD